MRQGNINLGFLYANSRKEFGIPNFKRISPPQSMSLPILSLYSPTNAVPDTSASAPRYECVCPQTRMCLAPRSPRSIGEETNRNTSKPLSTGHLTRKTNNSASRNRLLAHFCNPFINKTNSGDFPMQWLER